AGIAITKLLRAMGATQIDLLDSKGIVAIGRGDMNREKDALAVHINPSAKTGTLADAMRGADVFIGVSRPNLVSRDMVRSMNDRPIVFALANPDPEILPDDALAAGAAVVATGRSDYPNQVNNVLVYPGLFRGLLNRRASTLTDDMKIAAVVALAGMVPSPTAECILPSILDTNPAPPIAAAIATA
ncbi:MAG: NAD-dependent malic enzyme, partial [bacterium]|nr:NAD-dependent malic enzyme [bacterium]